MKFSYLFDRKLSLPTTYHPADRVFMIFWVGHLLLWTLVIGLSYGNPPIDALESISWGNLWLLGYPKHPFLAAWLSAGFTHLFGVSGWSIYFLGQLAVCVCFWAVWRLANKIVNPWQALIAVVLLEGIAYYNLLAANFNPDQLMLPMWALLTLNFYNAIRDQKISQWLWVGVFSGLAMLSKYESAILIFLMFLILLITPEGRQSFLKPGLYLAILLSLIIFSPNLYSIYQNHFDSVTYVVGEFKFNDYPHLPPWLLWFLHPLLFLLSQIYLLLPLLLLYIPFYSKKASTRPPVDRFNQIFVGLLAFGPLSFTLAFSLITNSHLKSGWGFPFFSLIGLWWVMWLRPEVDHRKLRNFAWIVSIVMIYLVIRVFLVNTISPYFTHKANHTTLFPGQNIAAAVTDQWHHKYHTKLDYVVGEKQSIVNISAFSADLPIPFFNANKKESPWINENALRNKGAVFVYRANDSAKIKKIEGFIKENYPNLLDHSIQSFNYQTQSQIEPLKLWIGFLSPLQDTK